MTQKQSRHMIRLDLEDTSSLVLCYNMCYAATQAILPHVCLSYNVVPVPIKGLKIGPCRDRDQNPGNGQTPLENSQSD
jgi:hypothetical protein